MRTYPFSKVVRALVIAVLTLSNLIVPASAAVAAPAKAPLYEVTYDCTAQSEIPPEECNALVDLYNSTNGASWTNQDNWLTTDTPSNWYGVAVSYGHVVILNVSGNNLNGTIPDSIGDLTYADQIWLFDNQLSGSIPTTITNLVNLTKLGLFNNQLTDNLPADIGDMTNLTHLSLDRNQLSGEIPASITSLAGLTEFSLSCGQTTTDPDVIMFLSGKFPGWYLSYTSFTVGTDGDWLAGRGCGWSPDMPVTVTVDDDNDPDNGNLEQIVQNTDENSNLDVGFSVNLIPGQYVTMDDGTTVKTMQIPEVYFDDVNQITDVATGRGPANGFAKVHVKTVTGEADVFVQIGVDGNWVADFGDAGFDIEIVLDTSVEAFDSDWDGATASQPTISVLMPGYFSYITGQHWPEIPDIPFILTVDDPDTTDKSPDYTREWDTPEFDLFDFPLEPDFTISLTYGTTTRTVVVSEQSIQSVNPVTGMVSGVTPSSMPLTITARCGGTTYTRYISSPVPGATWTVDFSGSTTLTYACKITSSQNYPDGNLSKYQWPHSSPGSQADPMNDWVSAERWPPGTRLTLTIDDSSDGIGGADADADTEDYATGPLIMGAIGENPISSLNTYLLFDLGDYDLKSYDVVTIHAGPDDTNTDIHQLTYTIDRVNITSVDIYKDIVYGIAPPNEDLTLFLGPNVLYGIRHIHTVDAPPGTPYVTWEADFSKPKHGGEYEEQFREDLTPESTIDVDINSHTEVHWPSTKTREVDSNGRIVFSENMELDVPSGAIGTSTEFNIVETGSGFQVIATDDTGEVLLDAVASATIGPDGASFGDKKATVIMEWPDADNNGIVDQTTINEADLYVSKDGVVIAGPCSSDLGCDPVANTFSVQVQSLSDYVIGSQAANHEPSVNSTTLVVDDNASDGTSVGTISYTDVDAGQTHTCSIYDGNVDNAFAIDASTCEISVNDASKIDYIVKPSYSLKVRVTDDGAPARHGDAVITVNVIRCYALTLGHKGNGSDPTVNPTNSTGCAAGSYVDGENISFTNATPDAGWQIRGWTGTSNNSSTASTNSLVMPTSNSSVNVNYTAIPVQVAKNGGFNIYSGTSKVPKYWVKSTNFASTDGKDTSIKKEGAASVRISGAAGKTKMLTQTLSLSGAKGQSFVFSYWVKGSAMPTKGSCYGQVLFYYGTNLKGTKTLKCPTGATYTWKQVNLNLTAPAAYNKVLIRFTYSKASGRAWFDLASLLR
jgi:hypothetical protein